jgi:hypothetical protein
MEVEGSRLPSFVDKNNLSSYQLLWLSAVGRCRFWHRGGAGTDGEEVGTDGEEVGTDDEVGDEE